MRNIIRHLCLCINIIAAVLLLFIYVAPRFDPAKSWIPSVMSLSYPHLMIINAGFIVIWLFSKRLYSFISIITILIGINIHFQYFQLSGESTKAQGIKVVSYNVHYFNSYLESKPNDEAILDFIANQKADIICLQETKLQKTGILNPVKLKERFPGINHCQLAHASQWNGPVTFSRYPITNMGEIRFKDSGNMVIYTDIAIKSDTIRVFNCHLQSYRIKTDDYSIIDSIDFKKEELRQAKEIMSKLKNGNIQRSEQVHQLVKMIKTSPYPTIVCGDFNDTPLSYTYHEISQLLNDSFVESGSGIGNTYQGKLPSYRIDYIFHNDQYKAFNFKRHKVDYSDHYPISTTLIKMRKSGN